ncbi:unnamed protein product [Acanthosepion pharaonis]|uniref:Uncharacterized protein n=1 Tax=Acanthosepion pharaonis TaxID=158019 RepID=A0A812E0B5_ACAPH|nr:unnamed protein product [Sepia pharaonis]
MFFLCLSLYLSIYPSIYISRSPRHCLNQTSHSLSLSHHSTPNLPHHSLTHPTFLSTLTHTHSLFLLPSLFLTLSLSIYTPSLTHSSLSFLFSPYLSLCISSLFCHPVLSLPIHYLHPVFLFSPPFSFPFTLPPPALSPLLSPSLSLLLPFLSFSLSLLFICVSFLFLNRFSFFFFTHLCNVFFFFPFRLFFLLYFHSYFRASSFSFFFSLHFLPTTPPIITSLFPSFLFSKPSPPPTSFQNFVSANIFCF